MIRDWNIDKFTQQLWSMGYEMNNPRNDGFTTWPIKQDLYKLKWMIDQMLAESPTYAPEEEWLLKQEKEKMWRILTK
jgi:hypothetical protein